MAMLFQAIALLHAATCFVQSSPIPKPHAKVGEGTTAKHLYRSSDPPQMTKKILQCSVSYGNDPNLPIFLKK